MNKIIEKLKLFMFLGLLASSFFTSNLRADAVYCPPVSKIEQVGDYNWFLFSEGLSWRGVSIHKTDTILNLKSIIIDFIFDSIECQYDTASGFTLTMSPRQRNVFELNTLLGNNWHRMRRTEFICESRSPKDCGFSVIF